jgi:hypothetical protein
MQNARTCGIVGAFWLLSLAGGAAARAGTITLSVSGADTGTITLTETGNGSLITGISGTFDGSTIGSLIAAGGIGSNDNLFFTPAPYLDNSGVSFTLTTPDSKGFSDVNFGYGGVYGSAQGNGTGSSTPITIYFPDTVTVASGVPEPASVCLVLTGLSIFLVIRRTRLTQGTLYPTALSRSC